MNSSLRYPISSCPAGLPTRPHPTPSTAYHRPRLNNSISPRHRMVAGSAPSGTNHAGVPKGPTVFQVLTYVPNLIGYLRVGLVCAAEVATRQGRPHWALGLYLGSFALDGADGAAARVLKQETAFGAFLDVVIDNLTRAALWSRALPGLAGVLVPCLEWVCFAVTYKAGGRAWKEGCFKDAPAWVRAVMARNFKTPLGVLAVAGLMGLPLWCWGNRLLPGHPLSNPVLGAVLCMGRLVAASVELWLVKRALLEVIHSDVGPPS